MSSKVLRTVVRGARIGGPAHWDGAKASSESMTFQGIPGHLATITSFDENNFVASILTGAQYWIGGQQLNAGDPPADGWSWISGESWCYTNWAPGEPNDATGDEHQLSMYGPSHPFFSLGTWNDERFGEGITGYIVEYPLGDGTTSSDCNNNGIPDECDIADATSLDENGNGIPDECEDLDGDGISDDEDDCPDSDLGAVIVVDECETGVENQLLENGCTMADLITRCAEGVANHGAFVRCVAHLTNLWKCEGLIAGGEKGAIQSCAGGSEIP